ncbi:hypothetical protein [Poriferisphaera sp. WC338]|uniref:hypothetical protein n=1 Tax=Poriferisphaera sp. WC338 TaxID=3425129 RepID=UPI003D817278
MDKRSGMPSCERDDDRGLWESWRRVAVQPTFYDAITSLYRLVDEEIGERGPRCDASGRCCQFNTYGHLLYVTGVEIVWVLGQLDQSSEETCKEHSGKHEGLSLTVLQTAERSVDDAGRGMDGCVYQTAEGLCGAHAVRPLGCRVYYCDPEHQDWQNDLYEKYLDALKKLHQQYDMPYRYMEWRAGLAEASKYL